MLRADEVKGFTTTTVVGPDVQTVYVAGELDLNSNAEASAAFTIAVGAGLPIVVDLTDLDFMDCGGYRAIATARHAAEQHGIALTITNAQGEPARLLNLLGEQRRGCCDTPPPGIMLMSGVAVITEPASGPRTEPGV